MLWSGTGSWVTGNAGHGSTDWWVMWVTGNAGHGSADWWVMWVTGHKMWPTVCSATPTNCRCLLHATFYLYHSHEDGSVRFWDVSGSCLRLLYKLETALLFGIDTLPHSSPSTDDLTDDWPPFRKVSISSILSVCLSYTHWCRQQLYCWWSVGVKQSFLQQDIILLSEAILIMPR